MNNPQRSYRAFISYSHQDRRFAEWLHKKLETYRIPAKLRSEIPTIKSARPLSPVFLDREELASASSLSASIVNALDASAALVVVCSPAAAQSRWVNEEILHFRQNHPERPVFAIVCRGDPGADPRIKPNEAAVPLNLLLESPTDPEGTLTEPGAVDARREADGRQAALLKLLAGLLAIPYDRLRQREAWRKRKAMAILAIGSIALTTIFAILAWRATVARDEAQQARTRAELELLSERQTRNFLLSVFQLADPGEARGEEVTVREVLDSAVSRIESTEFARPVIKSRFLSTMGQAYSSLGMNRKSVELLHHSLEQLGTDGLDAEDWRQRIDSELELADVLYDMGEYDEAHAGLERAGSGPARVHISPLQLAYAKNIQGDILSYLEQDEMALNAYQDSLAHLEESTASREETASSRSRSLGGMAMLDLFAGNYRGAMEKFAQTVETLLPVFGERHPDSIWSLVSWGSAAYSAGDTETARIAWTRSLTNAEEVLGHSHPEVGTVKNNLGRLLFESGHYAEAEKYLREALRIDNMHRSENFDDKAFTLNSLGLVRMARGDPVEARVLWEEAQSIAEQNEHRILGPVLTSLADLDCVSGNAGRGLILAEQALDITQREYGPDDWRSQRALLVNLHCRELAGEGIDVHIKRNAAAAVEKHWGEESYFGRSAMRRQSELQ